MNNENKLISEFMGVVFHDDENQYCDSEGYYIGLDLKYHTSWDWLMPVVEEIELLGYTFEKNLQRIDKDWQCLIVKGNDILYQEFNTDSLIACHYVVIEFIKWYNEQ
mgnify:FL=1